MIRWPDGPTSSDTDSTCRIGRKKADEDQLQPTVRNTLRKLSRPTKKNCPTANRRLGSSSCPADVCKDVLRTFTGRSAAIRTHNRVLHIASAVLYQGTWMQTDVEQTGHDDTHWRH
ncbi:hypothetical protein DPX16_14202 [Anabarilius grahami]|uniref:Uncharacterized protein n=1 Tax=Anabarilius grahami TaxID=495550 RepID=A0A3N0XF85_ANAGA|nr:hypothetical protein DPX16_14202 [Anabarilius grahami]